MNTDNFIAQKMESIQSIFREVQEKDFGEFSITEIADYLNSFDLEFRSIAYEAAAMNLALIDLKQGNKLAVWLMYLKEIGAQHAIQIHVGLGWAFAQEQLNPELFLNKLEPMLRYRVLDGYGYYEGIFRRRKSIINQQAIEIEDATALSAYYQGLGRSIWYSAKGNIDVAKIVINSFPVNRLNDLWRGLGIAITYVGGCSESNLQTIFDTAGNFQIDLATGAAMTLISRDKADSITSDALLTCKMFCSKNADEIFTIAKDSKTGDDFLQWIKHLENSFIATK
jgi:hypothetical protein